MENLRNCKNKETLQWNSHFSIDDKKCSVDQGYNRRKLRGILYSTRLQNKRQYCSMLLVQLQITEVRYINTHFLKFLMVTKQYCRLSGNFERNTDNIDNYKHYEFIMRCLCKTLYVPAHGFKIWQWYLKGADLSSQLNLFDF